MSGTIQTIQMEAVHLSLSQSPFPQMSCWFWPNESTIKTKPEIPALFNVHDSIHIGCTYTIQTVVH